MDEALKQLFKNTKFPQQKFKITKLFGQASYREYFRIEFEDASTAIVMKIPVDKQELAEEVTKTNKKIEELAFINVQRYLFNVGVCVPELFAYSKKDGLLLLSDLGNTSLENDYLGGNTSIYEKAIDLLVDFQNKTQKKDEDCLIFHRKFDDDLLYWEWEHFLEFGIEDRYQIKIEKNDRKQFEEIGRDIVQKITKMPYGITHRDFQSRNLMVTKNGLALIDFQDALKGPLVYDLVSLLRDSYINLDLEFRKKLINRYLSQLQNNHPYQNNKNIFSDFDVMTLQRKLKDAGRFQYIHTVKKNPDFLKHVDVTLGYVEEALSRLTEYVELEKLLNKYLVRAY